MKTIFAGIAFLILVPGLSLAGALPAVVGGEPLPSLAPMLERVTPAVVNIATRGEVKQAYGLSNDPFFRRFFDLPELPSTRPTHSLGSGVIVDAERGLVVTNFHVIENATEILVTLRDGREALAELVGSDPHADVALIRLNETDLVDLEWADSDKLRVGDFCVAIGNPFGLGQTVTSGIVSALGRSGLGIEDFEDFIQTDASINPGNSGGALVDLNGNLIGINTAIVGPSGGNVGIGFAIPANMVVDIVEQLLEYGEVQRGELGISAQPLTAELARAFGVPTRYGVVIGRVRKGSPADEAGLEAGDVITAIDDEPVRDIRAVKNRIGLVRLGQRLKISIIRNAKARDIVATVGALQRINPLMAGAEFAREVGRGGRPYVIIESLEPGSPLDTAGLQAGDIILSVNRQYVDTVDALEELSMLDEDEVLLLVQRGQTTQYVRLR